MAQVKSKTGFRGPAEARIATQWKPGQSGNPGGRPKMRAYSEACREIGRLPMSEIQQIVTDPESTGIEVVTAQQIIKAAKGFSASAVWVSDRAEGKPMQPIAMHDAITEQTAKEIVEVWKIMEGDPAYDLTPKSWPDIHEPKPLPDTPDEAKVLTQGDPYAATAKATQKALEAEQLRALAHTGKPFPSY